MSANHQPNERNRECFQRMDDRSQSILSLIIEHYIHHAEPLGSRVLSRMLENRLSAATIRNVMSDLTELGLIEQPHTSAGRIPTDAGYRYYVDRLKPEHKLVDYLQAHQRPMRTPQALEELLLDAAEELTEITRFTGFVVTPEPSHSRLKQIKFIPMSTTQVLVILITQTGMVKHRILQFRECPDFQTLEHSSELLNELFFGMTLSEIQARLLPTLDKEQTGLSAQAIRLGKKAFELDDQSQIFISGESNLCGFPEFRDQSELQSVFQLFEDKKTLLGALKNQARFTPKGRIQIAIGQEMATPGLAHCSVLSADYGNLGNRLGFIGIIGPTRMDYNRAIEALEYSSNKLSQVVSTFLNEQ